MSVYGIYKQGVASLDATVIGCVLSKNARKICKKHSEWVDLTTDEKRNISPLDYPSFKAFKNLGGGCWLKRLYSGKNIQKHHLSQNKPDESLSVRKKLPLIV